MADDAIETPMRFVPTPSFEERIKGVNLTRYTDWVATEKVEGANYQLYTENGRGLHYGSRTRPFERNSPSPHIRILRAEYKSPALRLWHVVKSESRWLAYRAPSAFPYSEDSDDDNNVQGSSEDNETVLVRKEESQAGNEGNDNDNEQCEVRIYGELFGGGGIRNHIINAVRREIIYSDTIRFYVMGITINHRWVTITQLGELCEKAGFPCYATPLCEPKSSPDEVKQFLSDNGLIKVRSRLTEKEGEQRTRMRGVVITPLVRPGYKLPAVTFFNNFREDQFEKAKTGIICTKERYKEFINGDRYSRYRFETEFIVNRFVDELTWKTPVNEPSEKMRLKWRERVLEWLKEDGYIDPDKHAGEKEQQGRANCGLT